VIGAAKQVELRFIPACGLTEASDAELTDQELMAQGRHKSRKVLGKYVKRTMRQVAKGTPETPRGANERRTGFWNEQQHRFWNGRLTMSNPLKSLER
jgi:hypothetical protein